MSLDDPTRPASPAQLDWLGKELTRWQAEGLLTDDQSAAIRSRYHASRRFSLGRLLLTLGAIFVGVGLIWLVAANLDALPPLARFAVVAFFWLALLVGGELLADRHDGQTDLPSPVAGSVRLLAALAFGAVVFQAAQSLQVPAYEPVLVGIWSLGALVHAYAVRSITPLAVGIVTGVAWFLWQVLDQEPSGLAGVLVVTAAAVLLVSVGTLHERRLTAFAPLWRETGWLLALGGLFVAALPFVDDRGFGWHPVLVASVVAAGLALVAALALSSGTTRLEPLGSLVVLLASVVLVLWEAGNDSTGPLHLDDVAHALVSVGLYVLVAVGVAVLGTLRDSWRLTALSTLGLVVFTTFQSFAVFARIIEGAWLFVILGAVFLGTGFLFDRARRELAAGLEGAER